MVFTIKTFEKRGLKKLSKKNQDFFIKEFMAHSRQVIHTLTWLALTTFTAIVAFVSIMMQNEAIRVSGAINYFSGVLLIALFCLFAFLIKSARGDMFDFLELLKKRERADKAPIKREENEN